MKNLKLIITAIALTVFTTSSVYANSEITEVEAKNQLRTELVSLLGENSNVELNGEAVKANVSFMINENNEIIVVYIDCENKSVCSYVRSKLNYKKIDAVGITKDKIYVMPLKIEGEA